MKKDNEENKKLSHASGILSNKLAKEAEKDKNIADNALNDLKKHQGKVIEESTGKTLTNIILTILAIGLIFANIILDSPAIQNIFNYQGNQASFSYLVAIGLVLSAVLFGCLLEESIEPRLTTQKLDISAINDSNDVFGRNRASLKNSQRWLYAFVGIIGTISLGFAIYRMNVARLEMINNLNMEGADIEKNVILFPVLLYVAEVIASIGIIPTLIVLYNFYRSKSLMATSTRYTNAYMDKSVEAIELWKAYMMELDRHNKEYDSNEKAIPPNSFLKELLVKENLFKERRQDDNPDLNENIEDSKITEESHENQDNELELNDITNKPY